MVDYDAARAKVKKLVEKPSDDTTRLPRAQAELDEAKDIFTLMNDQLIAELPLLVDLRIRRCLLFDVRPELINQLTLTRRSRR